MGRVSVSRLDLGLRLNFRTLGHIACLGAFTLQVFNGFRPSYEVELLLWLSVSFFVWDKR